MVAVIALGAIGLVSSTVLYVCSKKFAVKEDARIGEVAELLPQANCGGCGFAGCAGLADALVKGADAGSIEGLFCPVGGQEVMGKVADLLGMAVANTEPMVAVVRCNGTCANRPRIAEYSGLRTCAAITRAVPARRLAAMAASVAAIAWLRASLAPSRSIPRQASPRSTKTSVPRAGHA